MKPNELMIGDWVSSDDGNAIITTIAMDGVFLKAATGICAASFDRINPIPLTQEILEKNFRGYKNGNGYLTYFIYELNEKYFISANLESIDLCMHYDDSEHAVHDDIYLLELMYVHTLQHALRLCGVEKEIIL